MAQSRNTDAKALLDQALPVLLEALPRHWLTAEALILRVESQHATGADDVPRLVAWLSTSEEILDRLADRPAHLQDIRRTLSERASSLRQELEPGTAKRPSE